MFTITTIWHCNTETASANGFRALHSWQAALLTGYEDIVRNLCNLAVALQQHKQAPAVLQHATFAWAAMHFSACFGRQQGLLEMCERSARGLT